MAQNDSNNVPSVKPQFLCVKVFDKNGKVLPLLSYCPAKLDLVISAMQYLDKGIKIEVSYQDNPIDFDKVDM